METTVAQQCRKSYDRIMGAIPWILIALVALYIKFMPVCHSSRIFLAIICVLFFLYSINARYNLLFRSSERFRSCVDLVVLLAYIVAVCWHTGRINSPFVPLICLVLLTAPFARGPGVTRLMSVLAIISCVLLASDGFYSVTRIIEIFLYALTACAGVALAREMEYARRELERLSLTDEVTGLNNMRNFFILSKIQERLARRHKRNFAICMLDADGLKAINDQYGYPAGTELIRQIAEIVKSSVRRTDIYARYGGDEFVIMFNEASKNEMIMTVEKIIARVAATPFYWKDEVLTTTISAGLAEFPSDGDDLKSVMANADTAMYASKRAGRNRLTIYGESASA